jgi:hypothetical protein
MPHTYYRGIVLSPYLPWFIHGIQLLSIQACALLSRKNCNLLISLTFYLNPKVAVLKKKPPPYVP